MNESTTLSRRGFLLGSAGFAGLTLAGCATTAQQPPIEPVINDYYLQMYGPRSDEQFPVPAVNLRQMNPNYWRTVVPNTTGERPGTIVVSTDERYLYLVGDDGTALRYGVGIGREGFAWSGRAEIAAKKKWPTWTPPSEMIARQPEIEQYRNGMPPSLENPLGARAMYIYQNGRDTLYRLHGTSDPRSIGLAVSSGCVRLINQDVIDLFQRVPTGTPVVVV